MSESQRAGERILGRLGTRDGAGVVTVQDRFDTDIDDLWSAVTDPARIARWLGEVEGDLRVGGEFRAHFSLASGWEGTGTVEACEPPRRLLVRTVDHKGDEQVIEATLTADGDQTIFTWEERGMPARLLAPYGAGIQAQVEDLGAYLAGGTGADFGTRWSELHPAYEELAANTLGSN
jgi:uncharacterized protein YndB with AHSA1/START domain